MDDRKSVLFGLWISKRYKPQGDRDPAPMTANWVSDTLRTIAPNMPDMSTMPDGSSITWFDMIPTANRPFCAFLVYVTIRVAGFNSI